MFAILPQITPFQRAARRYMHSRPRPARRAASFCRRLRGGMSALAAILLAVALLPALPARAQGPFDVAIRVNGDAVTYWEIDQRARLLVLLGAPGDPPKIAREHLVDDRLRMQAARLAGLVPTDEEIRAGMEEFAGRANMDLPAFLQLLAQNDIAQQTFRDFVRAGIAWRKVVAQRFARRAEPSEVEVRSALLSGSALNNVRVLLSEIIIPMTPENAAQVRQIAAQLAQIRDPDAFSEAARVYSAAPSRENGGRLPWQFVSRLPPQLRPIVLGLAPGEVSDPLPLPDAIALFQLRDIDEAGYTPPRYSAIEYAILKLPGGRSPETLERARDIAAQVDVCDDLYGIARQMPADRLIRESRAPDEIEPDLALELNRLDPGEVSTTLTRDGGRTLLFVMLCSRSVALPEDTSIDQVRAGLRNRRLANLAESYLAQLRADARIWTP